jgi:molecular chaperone DnaJ
MAPQREWFEKDYYQVLGVSESATEKEITRAYRKLAKQYHPDANPGAEEQFKEVSAAYDVLGDADKRKEYDEVRRLGPVGSGFGGFGGFGGAGQGAGPQDFDIRFEDATGAGGMGGLGDLLGGIFNRGGRGTARGAGPQRGPDLEAELHMSFQDAVEGVTTTVNVMGDAVCHTCHGSGAAPGTTPTVCPRCSGRGVLDDNQGLFSFSQPCPTCGGRGVRIETPCPTCHGSGAELRARRVRVRIPPGVEDGQRIRVKGRGGPGRNNGPPGDLYVVVRVASHELFGRRGKDLTLTVPLTFSEAALGSTIRVPTLEEPVTLRIPPGTPSGRTFRVRGRGVKSGKSAGDLLVSVEVAVPSHLTEAQREAVEALASASDESPRDHLGV